MHLDNGDYILIGPDHFENINISRTRDNELWWLGRTPGAKPIKFNEKMSEGMAISKTSMKVAYSQVHAQVPEVPDGASRLVVADVTLTNGAPALANKKVVYESKDRELHDRSAGLLRSRHEDDVHVLRAEQRSRP